MKPNPIKQLRITIITLLSLLVIQFEFGMAVNILNPPSISPIVFSLSGILNALHQVGAIAIIHAGLGTALTVLALASLGMALASKIGIVQVFGSLAFLTMALAATSGLLFVLSGFQNDGYSHGMATNFILTFGFNFLELYFLKPAPRIKDA